VLYPRNQGAWHEADHLSGGHPVALMIYLLNAIGLSPDGSSSVHIYKQTIHRTTQNK